MNSEERLTRREKADLVLEAGIASIPYVGPILQTMYFGSKNEKRFKRVERFYKELHSEIESVKKQLPDINEQNGNYEGLGILETINDEVEKAASHSKINYYKKAYKNTLLNFNDKTLDNEKYFVRLLPELTDLEINILFESNKNQYKRVKKSDFYNSEKSNTNLIEGSINRLVNFGLIEITFGTLISGPRGSEIQQNFSVSELGSEFIKFIFE